METVIDILQWFMIIFLYNKSYKTSNILKGLINVEIKYLKGLMKIKNNEGTNKINSSRNKK